MFRRSPPNCSTSCTQHARISRQFWMDENNEKEEVLMVSIDTCIPSSQKRSTSAVCDRPAAAVESDRREKQMGLRGAEKRQLTTCRYVAWPRAHLPAASRRTRRCRCATRATPAAQAAPPTPAPRHSADTGTTRPRPKPRPLPQPGRTPCPADPAPPLYRPRPAAPPPVTALAAQPA
jgi:hypothetical protein